MNFSRSFLIFKNTMGREYRSKTLIFIAVATFLSLLLANALLDFLMGVLKEYEVLVQGMGDQTLSFLLAFTAISAYGVSAMLGSQTVSADQKSNVLPLLLAFPIKRSEYLLARLTGSAFMVFIYYICTYFLAVLVFTQTTGASLGSWMIIPNAALMFFIFFTLILFSFFYSLFLPRIFSSFFTLMTVLFVSLANSLAAKEGVATLFSEFSLFRWFSGIIHILMPRVGEMFTLAQSFMQESAYEGNMMLEFGHFAISLTVLSILMIFIFRRKNL